MPLSPLPDRTALRLAWGVFLGAIAFSLAGTLLLLVLPDLYAVFGPYYATLVKTPTWTYMALLPVLAVLFYRASLSPRRLLAFGVWGAAIGAASELLGTTTGVPFGAYSYTAWLGPKIAGHVPWSIPLSWFALSIVCYDLAGRVARTAPGRILGTAVLMVIWDVGLDPAMSRAFPFWTYGVEGFYYGMPLSNWAGWFGVSLVIAAGYHVLDRGRLAPHPHAAAFFAANCAFPILLCALYGLWGAAFAGVVAAAVALWVVAPMPSGARRPVPSFRSSHTPA